MKEDSLRLIIYNSIYLYLSYTFINYFIKKATDEKNKTNHFVILCFTYITSFTNTPMVRYNKIYIGTYCS